MRGLCVPRRFSVYPAFPANPRLRDSPPRRPSRQRRRLSRSLGIDKRLHVTTASVLRARIHLRTDTDVLYCTTGYRATQADRGEAHESERVRIPSPAPPGRADIGNTPLRSPAVVHSRSVSCVNRERPLDAWPNYPLARRLARQ